MINRRLILSPLLIAVMTFGITPIAKSATIKQILIDANKAAVSVEEGEMFSVGEVVLAVYESKNCSLKVEEIKPEYMIVDLSKCSFKENLRNGDKLEKSFIQPIEKNQEEPVSKVEEASESANEPSKPIFSLDKIKFGGGVYLTTANSFRFDNVFVTTGTGSGTGNVTFNSDSSFGLGIAVMRIEPNQWGYSLGLNYEAERQINSVTVSGVNGTSYGSYNNGPKISLLFVEANLLYRWEKFYLPFGLNYSFPEIKDSGPGSMNYKGDIGTNFGVGVILSPNTSAEINFRLLGVQLTTKDGTTSVDYGRGNLSGLMAAWKIFF